MSHDKAAQRLCAHAVLLELQLVLCFQLYKEQKIKYALIQNLLRYTCAKDYQNSAWFDKVIVKIK